ncbi:MAG: helix-turn-helix transcriptional regulator [Deltaproteobacteria bacterium]|nr:helix-turn-helix transcriptional regulator [Deltaproteobacteria bacterium]
MTTDEARMLRDRILTAAAELIEQRGAQRVSVEDVAERIGIESVVIAVRFPDVPALVAAMVAQFHEEFPSVLCRFAGYEEPSRPRKRDRKKSGRRMVLQGRPIRAVGPHPGSIAEALALFVEQRGAVVRVALATPELAWLRTSAGVAERVRGGALPPALPIATPDVTAAVEPAGAALPKPSRTLLGEPPPH